MLIALGATVDMVMNSALSYQVDELVMLFDLFSSRLKGL